MIYIKPIKDFEGLYSISEDGKIFSHKSNKYISTYKSNYIYVRLYKNGKTYHYSLHRLLAINFIPNPNNLPIVDHINNNPFDNRLENLQWCTQGDNVRKEYDRYSPIRNFVECKLYKNNKLIGAFKSVNECCRYCATLGLSYTGMNKYRHTKNKEYVIKV